MPESGNVGHMTGGGKFRLRAHLRIQVQPFDDVARRMNPAGQKTWLGPCYTYNFGSHVWVVS